MSKRTRRFREREERKRLKALAPVLRLREEIRRKRKTPEAKLLAAGRQMASNFGNWEADWNKVSELEAAVQRLCDLLLTCGPRDRALEIVAGEMAMTLAREARAITWEKESRRVFLPKCTSRNGEKSELVRVRRKGDAPENPAAFGN